jgi:hypothetical protein
MKLCFVCKRSMIPTFALRFSSVGSDVVTT